jgi:hypothetical protein
MIHDEPGQRRQLTLGGRLFRFYLSKTEVQTMQVQPMQKCKLGNNPAAISTSDYRFHTAEHNGSRFVFTFAAIGTQWQIETDDPLDDQLRQRILDRIQQFDATYSRFCYRSPKNRAKA